MAFLVAVASKNHQTFFSRSRRFGFCDLKCFVVFSCCFIFETRLRVSMCCLLSNHWAFLNRLRLLWLLSKRYIFVLKNEAFPRCVFLLRFLALRSLAFWFVLKKIITDLIVSIVFLCDLRAVSVFVHVIFVKIANISELKISGNTFDIFLGWLLCIRNYADLTNLTRDFNN